MLSAAGSFASIFNDCSTISTKKRNGFKIIDSEKRMNKAFRCLWMEYFSQKKKMLIIWTEDIRKVNEVKMKNKFKDKQ